MRAALYRTNFRRLFVLVMVVFGGVWSEASSTLITAYAADELQPMWIRHYDGPVRQTDQVTHLDAGTDGSLAVTGRSRGIGSNFDYLTIKYDPDGNELWAARYNGPQNWIDQPAAVGTDALGNVYVTGVSWNGLRPQGGEWDYVTIKYGPTGEQLWVQRYNGPGNWSDHPSAMEVDDAGNVYIAGFAFVEPDRFNRYATHFHVLKYDPDGNITWEHLIDDPARLGAGARDIALDAAGNVYGTGVVNGGDPWNNDDNILTAKVDPDGNLVYAVQYTSPGFLTGLDDGKFVTADAQGNAYVGGQVYTDGYRTWDTIVLKYDATGQLLWNAVNALDRPDGPRDIAVDDVGNVYVGGGWESPTDGDGLLIAYSDSGAELWRQIYDGPARYDQQDVWRLAIGSDGKLYVALDWQYEDQGGYDFTLWRHAPDGTVLDRFRFDAGSTSDILFAFDLDQDNNVYLGGYSFFSLTGADYTAIKVSGLLPPD